jgi:hypothetical protein
LHGSVGCDCQTPEKTTCILKPHGGGMKETVLQKLKCLFNTDKWKELILHEIKWSVVSTSKLCIPETYNTYNTLLLNHYCI